MSVLDKLIGVIAPHECLGCERQGSLLCQDCSIQLVRPVSSCYQCQSTSVNNATCDSCKLHSPLLAVYAATSYLAFAKDLAWRLKFDGAQSAAVVMARQMAPLFNNKLNSVLVPVPTSAKRRRQRGYDQAVLLARQLSRLTGLPALPCLARTGTVRQVGAHRAQRLAQLQGIYRLTVRPPRSARLILVDDIVTTGATLTAAAAALAQAGLQDIEAVVFARA